MKKRKNNSYEYQKEYLKSILYLILSSSIFFLIPIFNNFIQAQNINPIIINETSKNTLEQTNIHYEDLNSKSYKLIILQIKIGTSKGNLDLLKINIENDILETINDAENLVREDIITDLKNVKKKREFLNDYLQNMDLTINKGNFFIMMLDQDITNRNLEMKGCIEEKKIADQEYFNSITYYDQQAMITALKKSSTYNICIAQARLEINAKTTLVNKLKFYHELLKKKYDFLIQKQEIILKNIYVLDQNILQELNMINHTLNAYNF